MQTERIKELLSSEVTSSHIRRFTSFAYLNATQFIGSLNDNIYKLLIVYFCIHLKGIESSHIILSTTGIVFVLPFLLFSSFSGIIADRFSKRNIIVATKVFELCIMIAGVFAFAYDSIVGSYLILFLIATQSAIFGPSKYGILPELVPTEKITKANGLMASFTFLAIIFGTFFASFLLDVTNHNFVLAAIFCTATTFISLITALCIEYTNPSGSSKRLNPKFLNEIWNTLKVARQDPSLITAVFGSAFFFFLGSFLQLNIIPYSVQSLHLTDIHGGYLFLLTAIGIGLGSLLAGKISGKTVELGLVPLAGLGITVCFYLLDFLSNRLFSVIPLLAIIGIFGGLFQIPMDSYTQVASPQQYRGQIIGASNFVSFLGVLLSAVLLYVIKLFGFDAAKGFTIMASITLAATIVIMFVYYEYVCRFVAMLISKLHFKTEVKGVEHIPDSAVVFICTHTAWNDTLLLLGSQRRRIRFFIEREQDHSKWLKKLYCMLRIVRIPVIEPLKSNQECLVTIKNCLDHDISVCILVDSPNISEEINKLNRSNQFNDIIQSTGSPIIPVFIQKGNKNETSQHLQFINKFRVPAIMMFESPR